MKIVFLDFDDIHNPLLGAGQAKATYEVGQLLAKRGHEVVSICSRYPGSIDRTENGIHYKHIGVGTKNIRLNNAVYIALMPTTVPRIKADIIIECFTAPVSTMLTPMYTKIPVVGLPTSFEAKRFSELYRIPFHLIERFGLSKYRYFMPYTEYFEKRMKDVNNNVKTHIVPEGVGAEFFKIRKQIPKHILFLGRYDMGQKGIDLLLQAYSKILGDVKYPLIIAGYGPDEAKIRALVTKLGLEKNVKFAGGAFGEKKAKLLSNAVFVAFPSRHEGFSLFSLEALASANAIAGFDIEGLSWAPETIALKAQSYNIDEYAEILKKLSDPKLAKKMGAAGRAFAKNYTWDRVAGEFEKFFNEIISSERS